MQVLHARPAEGMVPGSKVRLNLGGYRQLIATLINMHLQMLHAAAYTLLSRESKGSTSTVGRKRTSGEMNKKEKE